MWSILLKFANLYARKAIIEAAKRIINSDKVCHSYSDLNFGVTFLEHSVYACEIFAAIDVRPSTALRWWSNITVHQIERCCHGNLASSFDGPSLWRTEIPQITETF